MMPLVFFSSISLTSEAPPFETEIINGPAGAVSLVGEQPCSVSFTASALPPPLLPCDEVPCSLPHAASPDASRAVQVAIVPPRLVRIGVKVNW